MWTVALDGEPAVWTPASSGKVVRIRRDPTVTLAACDRRGAPLGDPVRGTARLLDATDTGRVRTLLGRKYGVLGRVLPTVLPLVAAMWRRDATAVGVAITLDG